MYGRTFGRKADNLTIDPFPAIPSVEPHTIDPTSVDISRYRCMSESSHAMVLVEKPSSCTETVKLEYFPATSASCMHVLAGHPATTPCLLAI
jgi:hypothetical protein